MRAPVFFGIIRTMNKARKQYCYFNGEIIPLERARISPRDIGLLRGYGVFDFFRTINGKPFLYDEHIERFKNSAKLFNFKLSVSDTELRKIIDKLIAKNGFNESNARIVLTGGEMKNGMGFDSSSPTFFILIEESKKPPARLYKGGVKLITLEHRREIPRAKTLNYISAVRLYNSELRKKKAFEILYTDSGRVLECSTSNFFIFSAGGGSASGGKGATLITPKKDILLGTTRNLVLKLARKDFKVQEREIKKSELRSADEAFITASNKDILPVVDIDGKKVSNGKVGENTQKLMDVFGSYVRNL